jgi:hypothetical protein
MRYVGAIIYIINDSSDFDANSFVNNGGGTVRALHRFKSDSNSSGSTKMSYIDYMVLRI